MDSMRLLFIAPSAYLLGGVQDWLYMLVLGLRERGHQVSVGVPDGIYHRLQEYNRNFPGLNAKGFINRTGSDAGRHQSLIAFLRDNPADLVVGVNIGNLYAAHAAIASRRSTSKLVMTLHAIDPDFFEEISTYASVLDGVITTNRLTEVLVKQMQAVPEQRVFYAPYGIVAGPEKTGGDEHRLRVAWAGRIENSQKRVSDLLPILVELDKSGRDYSLSIAGTGPCLDELRGQLGAWVQDGRVIFEGLVQKQDMPKYLAANDIFLITSEWETGPIVAWEAMAAGMAIVSSRYVGSWLEKALIHDSTALLYPIGDAQEACRQLLRLSDLELRQKLCHQGRQMALSRYSSQASIDAWEHVFMQVMALEQRPKLGVVEPRSTPPSGRLSRLLGHRFAEWLRTVLPLKTRVPDAGSEWPHAMHSLVDKSAILDVASALEAAHIDAKR
jgi:glycosyltransferase involved in cell wall biosynthesis